MNTGQIISGAGHLVLIAWALAGNLFASDPPAVEVTEVTAISTEEFAALTSRQAPPEATAGVATPQEPEPGGPAPDVAARSDTAPDRARPDAAGAADPDATPETLPDPPPRPETGDSGAAAPAPPALPEDSAALLPEPQPRAAPRVRPDPVAPPEPETPPAETRREERAPDAEAEAPEAEPSDAAAPEAATTEIVTEAEREDAAAPARSLRPRARPAEAEDVAAAPPEAPQETPPPEAADPAAEDAAEDEAVEAALAEALGGAAEEPAPAPAGPPLSRGEKEALRVAVGTCWNVGSLSSDALATTVTVAVEMSRDGTPVVPSIRMVGASGGSGEAARQAFEAARRAIIRCGAGGFDLPAGKYDRWRDIEMTFNPEKMRIK